MLYEHVRKVGEIVTCGEVSIKEKYSIITCLDDLLLYFIYILFTDGDLFTCIINIFFNYFFISHISYLKNIKNFFFYKIISNKFCYI